MDRSVQDIMGLVSASKHLGKAPRQASLLKYLLTENECGRLKNISQYSIAIDVLGRSDDFDPISDSIVRSEMRRLRKNLEQFNSNTNDVQLVIPRASFEVVVTNKASSTFTTFLKFQQKSLVYVATALMVVVVGFLSVVPKHQVKTVVSNCSSVIPNISVKNSGSSADLQLYTGKIIRSSLSQYTSIKLVGDIGNCSNSGTPSFTLDYMVFEESGAYRIALTTYNDQPSNIVGVQNIGGIITEFDSESDLYYSVVKSVGDLAKPYGKISRYAVTKDWAIEEIENNYKCMLIMYDSYTSDSIQDYSKALSCLMESSQSKFATLDNKGGLALSYIAQYRRTRNSSTEAPFLEAQRLIDGSGEMWIQSVEMTIAKILYEVDRPDYNAQRLKAVLNTAEKKYSENPHVLITIAGYAGFKLGDWERAMHLSNQVLLIHNETDNSVFLVRAAAELMSSQSEVDLSVCLLAYSENSLFSNLLVNSCARRTQNTEWIARTDNNLIKLDYSSVDKRVQYIESRQYTQNFSDTFVSSLRMSIN